MFILSESKYSTGSGHLQDAYGHLVQEEVQVGLFTRRVIYLTVK